MSKEFVLMFTGAIATVGVWLAVLHIRFVNLLENNHEEKWNNLDKPKIVSKTIRAERNLFRFLFSDEYRELKNPVLTMVGDDLKFAHRLFLSLIVLSFLFSVFV
ncbi:MAG: hypothetical protein GKR93_01650 [Gammaproteobacteria bacterium]|nr:hypothetical protein [Gammaproteobacteria bacterium]